MQFVVLPQALRMVIPGMLNHAIGFLLPALPLAVIGIFDLLNAAKASATDPQWLGFYGEAYLLVALVFFFLCFTGSRYSRWLEAHLDVFRGRFVAAPVWTETCLRKRRVDRLSISRWPWLPKGNHIPRSGGGTKYPLLAVGVDKIYLVYRIG